MAKARDPWLDTMEDFIGHPGWRLLEADCRHRINELKDKLQDFESWEHVCRAQGAQAVLSEFLNFPALLEALRKQHNDGE
jgi:hypothetical protein